MKCSPIDFKPTSQTPRLLRDIQQYWQQKRKEGIPSYEIRNSFFELDMKLDHEKVTSDDEWDVSSMLSWLKKNNAIEFAEDDTSLLTLNEPGYGDFSIYKRIFVRVRDIEPITYLQQQLFGESESPEMPYGEITYDARTHFIKCGSESIPLEASSIEACFCKMMFDQKAGERISWDIIAKEIYGKDPTLVTTVTRPVMKQRIKDTRRRLNKKLAVFFIRDYFRSEKSEYFRK